MYSVARRGAAPAMSRWSDERESHPHLESGNLGSYSWTTAAKWPTSLAHPDGEGFARNRGSRGATAASKRTTVADASRCEGQGPIRKRETAVAATMAVEFS